MENKGEYGSMLSQVARKIGRRAMALAGSPRKPDASSSEVIRRTFGDSVVRFLQIGSNDGMHGDPIYALARHNPRWSGILVEPVPAIFARLKANYGVDGRFVFENVAISRRAGEMSFYYVADAAKDQVADLPEWFDQLGSFNRQHIVKHLNGILEPFIVETAIQCDTVDAVLRRNHVDQLDLIHIDTEGHDWDILSQIDLSALRPKIVLFEHVHLSSDERQAAEEMLKTSRYKLQYCGNDTLATRLD